MSVSGTLYLFAGSLIGAAFSLKLSVYWNLAALAIVVLTTLWQRKVVKSNIVEEAVSKPEISIKEILINLSPEQAALAIRRLAKDYGINLREEPNNADTVSLDEAFRIARLFSTPESDAEMWKAIFTRDPLYSVYKHAADLILQMPINDSEKLKVKLEESVSNAELWQEIFNHSREEQILLNKLSAGLLLKMPVEDIENFTDKSAEPLSEATTA